MMREFIAAVVLAAGSANAQLSSTELGWMMSASISQARGQSFAYSYAQACVRLCTNSANTDALWKNVGTEAIDMQMSVAAARPTAGATSYVFAVDMLTGGVTSIKSETNAIAFSFWGRGLGDILTTEPGSANQYGINVTMAGELPIWSPPISGPCVYFSTRSGSAELMSFVAGGIDTTVISCVQGRWSRHDDSAQLRLWVNQVEWTNSYPPYVTTGELTREHTGNLSVGGNAAGGGFGDCPAYSGELQDIMCWVGTNIPTVEKLGLIYSNGANYGGAVKCR